MDKDRLHSIPSASHWFGGISPATVRAWLSRGWLKRTKVGRRTMIRESELQRFVEESTRRGLASYGQRGATEQQADQSSEDSQTQTESQGPNENAPERKARRSR